MTLLIWYNKSMEKTYIFKTKDEKQEVIIRGVGGMKKLEVLRKKFPNIKVQGGGLVTTIITDFEDMPTLEKEINY